MPSPLAGPEPFVENVYIFFHFRAFLKPCLREIFHLGNVTNLKNMILCIIWSISTVSKENLL